MLVFEESGKPENPKKNLSEQSRELQEPEILFDNFLLASVFDKLYAGEPGTPISMISLSSGLFF